MNRAELEAAFPVGSHWLLSPAHWTPGNAPVTIESIDDDGMLCIRRDDTTGQPWPDGKWHHRVHPNELTPAEER